MANKLTKELQSVGVKTYCPPWTKRSMNLNVLPTGKLERLKI